MYFAVQSSLHYFFLLKAGRQSVSGHTPFYYYLNRSTRKKLLSSAAIPAAGIILLLLILFAIFSSQKEKDVSQTIPEGQQSVWIRLSDNPVSFDGVNVDIQRVELLVIPDSCRKNGNDDDYDYDRNCRHDRNGYRDRDRNDCAVWDTLDITAGIYNLPDLSNGADTLLATGFTITGKIKKIRLTLGTQNSVVLDSVSYPHSSWNDFNRVTISVRGEDIDQINPSDLQLWLDFDAGRSIVKVRKNHFVLKPFLRVWLPAQTASLKGKILPADADADAVVSAISDGDTRVANRISVPSNYINNFLLLKKVSKPCECCRALKQVYSL